MEQKICETIKELRKRRNISQEILAGALDISVQAVSKWETGASLPDILQLPRIAQFFGISIDQLFYGLPEEEPVEIAGIEGLKDDDVLRIVQFRGKKYLSHDTWEKDKAIFLDITKIDKDFNMEVWGSTTINGDVKGNVEAEGTVCCGNIGGYIETNGNVNCGNVGGHIESNGCVNSGNIGGHLEANGGVNCGNIGGHLDAAGNVCCAEIHGDLSAGGNVECGNVSGSVENGGTIKCSKIETTGDINCNDLYCKQTISCKSINAEGGIHVEREIKID